MGLRPFVDSVCTMQSVHEDPNFIPKSLKRAVQDFSPFLGIQPDMRQHKQRLQARPRADITAHDITGISDRPPSLPESPLFPLRSIVPRSLHFPSCTAPRVQQCSACLSSPSRCAEGSWQHSGACKAGAASWLFSLCPDKAAPAVSQFGEKDCAQHRYHDFSQQAFNLRQHFYPSDLLSILALPQFLLCSVSALASRVISSFQILKHIKGRY